MKKMSQVFCAALFCFSLGHIDSVTAEQPPQFYSQATQDHFVYTLLCKLDRVGSGGHYLEIGAYHPITINNTYFFEKNYHWSGVSIDISNEFESTWHAARSNPLLIQDATIVNYDALLESFPPVIDYLSLDIDCHYDIVLSRIPFNTHIFKVITIEHDFYKYGDTFRGPERAILSSLGYQLLCPDVNMGGDIFEDWWIYPGAFTPETLALLGSIDFNRKDYREMAQILNGLSR